MKAKIILSLLILCGLMSCKKSETKDESQSGTETKTVENVDNSKLVSEIEAWVKKIEDHKKSLNQVEISTKDLRSQIKQKWSKIHFYTENNKVVRIKTYPYSQISNRTEEFYFENESLVFVNIEDDGAESADKDNEPGKQYYYKDGKFIKEVNNSDEKEHQIKNSDNERLMQEATEYLEIFKSKKT